MHIFSKAIAVELAKHDRNYVALSIGNDEYIVWDCASDHRVEFNDIEETDHVSAIYDRDHA